MNSLANIENSFSCKACVPKIRPDSAQSSPTKTRYISTKLRISEISRIIKPKVESFRTGRQVKIRKNKLVCDVGCSTRETFLETEKTGSLSPIVPSKSCKNYSALSFVKLNLPGKAEGNSSNISGFMRKSQEFLVPNLKRLIGLSHRDSLKSPKKKIKTKKFL
jgi:hypothetical protein